MHVYIYICVCVCVCVCVLYIYKSKKFDFLVGNSHTQSPCTHGPCCAVVVVDDGCNTVRIEIVAYCADVTDVYYIVAASRCSPLTDCLL